MAVVRGCDCRECLVHNEMGVPADFAPVTHRAERKGKTINVCSRCLFSGDVVVSQLVTEDDIPALEEYDYCGTVSIFAEHYTPVQCLKAAMGMLEQGQQMQAIRRAKGNA
jgi:hypothetical protein